MMQQQISLSDRNSSRSSSPLRSPYLAPTQVNTSPSNISPRSFVPQNPHQQSFHKTTAPQLNASPKQLQPFPPATTQFPNKVIVPFSSNTSQNQCFEQISPPKMSQISTLKPPTTPIQRTLSTAASTTGNVQAQPAQIFINKSPSGNNNFHVVSDSQSRQVLRENTEAQSQQQRQPRQSGIAFSFNQNQLQQIYAEPVQTVQLPSPQIHYQQQQQHFQQQQYHQQPQYSTTPQPSFSRVSRMPSPTSSHHTATVILPPQQQQQRLNHSFAENIPPFGQLIQSGQSIGSIESHKSIVRRPKGSEGEHDQLEMKLAMITAENLELKSAFQAKVAELDMTIKKYEREREEFADKMKRMEKTMRQLEICKEELSQEVIAQKEQFTEEKLNEAVSAILEEKNVLIEGLKNDIKGFQNEIKVLKEQNHRISTKIAHEYQLETLRTKSFKEDQDIAKERQLRANKDMIEEMRVVLQLSEQQLAGKEHVLAALVERHRAERDQIAKQRDQELQMKLAQINGLQTDNDRMNNDILLLQSQLLEEREKCLRFETQWREGIASNEQRRQEHDSVLLEKCLENQKLNEEKLVLLGQLQEYDQNLKQNECKVEQLLSVNSKLNEVNEEKQMEVQELNEELVRLKSENTQNEQQISRISQKLSSLEKDKETVLKDTEEVYVLKEKVQAQELHRCKMLVQELKQQLSQKECAHNDSSENHFQSLDEAHQKIAILNQNISELNGQLSQAEEAAARSSHDVMRLQTLLMEEQNTNHMQSQSIQNQIEKIHKLEDQKERLQRTLMEVQEENELSLTDLRVRLEQNQHAAQQREKELETELAIKQQRCTECEQELKDFKAELPEIATKLKAEREQLQNTVFELENRNDSLSQQNAQYSQRIVMLEEDVSQLQRKVTDGEQWSSKYASKAENLENECGKLKEKLKQVTINAEGMNQQLVKQIKMKDQSLAESHVQILELQTKLDRINQDLQRTQHLKTLMKEQIEEVEENLKKDLEINKEDYRKELLSKYEREKREISLKLGKLTNDLRQAENENTSLQNTLTGKDREMEALTSQLQRIAERETALYEKCKHLEQILRKNGIGCQEDLEDFKTELRQRVLENDGLGFQQTYETVLSKRISADKDSQRINTNNYFIRDALRHNAYERLIQQGFSKEKQQIMNQELIMRDFDRSRQQSSRSHHDNAHNTHNNNTLYDIRKNSLDFIDSIDECDRNNEMKNIGELSSLQKRGMQIIPTCHGSKSSMPPLSERSNSSNHSYNNSTLKKTIHSQHPSSYFSQEQQSTNKKYSQEPQRFHTDSQ